MASPTGNAGQENKRASDEKRSVKARFYQYFRLTSTFLYVALVARWAILYPLVGSKFLPGGIHEFLCYLLIYAATSEMFWTTVFHGFLKSMFSRIVLKNVNLLYFVGNLHFHDDYEHAPVLKSAAYSSFIVTVGLSQTYCHWCKLFRSPKHSRKTVLQKIDTYVTLPIMYLSEGYLLLLNLQTPSFHTYPWLQTVNKAVLVAFIPICLHALRKQVASQ
ncbi:LAME_0H20318g1_1 [Lachancea meyersii CBS 8951]|uniref:LAME_0H20318g1_1 n=1 Tax=Lachancea meyersii CBS 8951 TaxID=1266667 RepID=A0A1G4KJM2_9SACH|nr:LAME_0H20318g1_1 [Lachancea meyersii CBS 8951]